MQQCMVCSEFENMEHNVCGNFMWCHSCICLEGQRKFTEDICEDKLSLIPDLNSGSCCCESLVPRFGRNFLFTLDLFGFCVMLLSMIHVFITKQVPVMSWATILFPSYFCRKLSVNCICRAVVISFCCVVLHACF